jgi:hypothetical protein
VSTLDSTLAHPWTAPQRRRGSDYAELLSRVRGEGLLDRRPTSYAVRITINAALIVAGWTVFVLLGDSWWQLVTAPGRRDRRPGTGFPSLTARQLPPPARHGHNRRPGCPGQTRAVPP